jgi:hypothetical protein
MLVLLLLLELLEISDEQLTAYLGWGSGAAALGGRLWEWVLKITFL